MKLDGCGFGKQSRACYMPGGLLEGAPHVMQTYQYVLECMYSVITACMMMQQTEARLHPAVDFARCVCDQGLFSLHAWKEPASDIT